MDPRSSGKVECRNPGYDPRRWRYVHCHVKFYSFCHPCEPVTFILAGSLPLPLFLCGSLRFVTHRTAIRFPRALVGIDKHSLDMISKASSPGVAHYLALTRKKIFASDILFSGLATHFLPASKVPTLLMLAGRAAACPPPHTLQAITSSLGALVDYAGPSRLQTFQSDIDRIFSVSPPLLRKN